MVISVILPTYEQPENVQRSLAALENQTLDPEHFEVLVIDDSASDVVRGVVYPPHELWDLPLFYLRASPPRVGSFTAGRARNIGAANARGDLLVFIDQDVMLAPDALEKHLQAYERHGDNTVVLGLYHWMRNIRFGPKDVRSRFYDVVDAGLHGHYEDEFEPLPMDEPGPLGSDIRTMDFGDIDTVAIDAALGCLGGNIAYPRALLLAVGGFDEVIIRHGGEDADLGLTCKTHGATFCMWREIWGVHQWHGRNQKQNAEDVQINIDYIDRKHGIGKYAAAKKWTDARDWGDPQHYRKDAGGVLMKMETDPTYWVCRDENRMGIPTIQALTSLGFRPEQVMVVPASALARYKVHGWPS